MLDHETIQENQIIDRYLMNRLSEEEFEAFTNHFPTCTQCLEDLELTAAFQRDLASVGRETLEDQVVRFSLLAQLLRSRLVRGAMLVAAAALLFFVFNPMRQSTVPQPMMVQLESITRDESRPVINLALIPDQEIVFSRSLANTQFGENTVFQASILDRNGQDQAFLRGTSSDGSVTLNLPANTLKEGIYLLRLTVEEDRSQLTFAEYELHVSQGRK